MGIPSRWVPRRTTLLLRSVTPYERAYTFAVYLRGLAFLHLKKGTEAAAEFQRSSITRGQLGAALPAFLCRLSAWGCA